MGAQRHLLSLNNKFVRKHKRLQGVANTRWMGPSAGEQIHLI